MTDKGEVRRIKILEFIKSYIKKNTEIETMIVDGIVIDEKKIKLEDDNKVHNIEIIM